MPRRIRTQQYSFTAGVLDRTMLSRPDIRNYFAGASEILNMFGMAQGGQEMRPGLTRLAEIPEAAGGARLAPFKFSDKQAYLHVYLDRKLIVYRHGVKQAEITTPYTAAQIRDIGMAQDLDTAILTHPDHRYRKLMRRGSHRAWSLDLLNITNIPQYDFGSGAEPVWSARRGWPRKVRLYQGRLYFGGSRDLPHKTWGSGSNNYFDFTGTAATASPPGPLADDMVESALTGDGVPVVQAVTATDDLFFFTKEGIYVQTESPVDAQTANYFQALHDETPSAQVAPVVLDGSVLFVTSGEDGQKQSVCELVYDEARDVYRADPVSLLASSFIRDPVSIHPRLSSDHSVANHLFVVNGDGTVAVLNTRKSQKITGWSLLNTAGTILDAAVVANEVYFLIRRRIAGRTRYFIEKLDPTRQLDCSTRLTATPATTRYTGLSDYNGQTVALMGDGAYLGTATVIGGAVTTPYAVSVLEAGLAFDWVVETLPLELGLADGGLLGKKHRVTQVQVGLENAQALTVNGRPVSFTKFGAGVLDAPPQRYTGVKTVRLLGWQGGRDARGGTVRLSGRSTGRANILSLGVEVAV